MIWSLTHSGNKFPILSPQPDDVQFMDVAESLSKICRFTGHVKQPYSVAQHCLLVESILRETGTCELTYEGRKTLLYAILHDAHEYITSYISTPFKAAMAQEIPAFEAGFDTIIKRLDAAIFTAAGLDAIMPPRIKEQVDMADKIALATEQRDIMNDGPAITNNIQAFPKIIKHMKWVDACDAWTKRFRDLTLWDANHNNVRNII